MDVPREIGIAAGPTGTSLHDRDHTANLSRLGYKSKQRMSTSSSRKTKKRCPYCSFSSYYATSIKVHMRRHTGEKPYRCLQCNKSFRDKSNFNSHMKSFSHTSTSPGIDVNVLPKNLSNVEEMSATNVDRPVVSHLYSESLSSLDQQDYSPTSTIPSHVKQSQLYPIAVKANRRKPTVVRKNTGVQHAQSLSCSSEGGSFEISDDVLNADDLHAFRDNIDDIDQNLAHLKPNPVENDNVKSYSEHSHSSHEMPSMERQLSENDSSALNLSDLYSCRHCGIYFKNCILHTLHMGCHGYNDPFQCNICGVKCKDPLEFHCHFARATHNGSL